MATVTVKEVATTPIEGQKTGTSGLRKKAAVFSEELLGELVQSLQRVAEGRRGGKLHGARRRRAMV